MGRGMGGAEKRPPDCLTSLPSVCTCNTKNRVVSQLVRVHGARGAHWRGGSDPSDGDGERGGEWRDGEEVMVGTERRMMGAGAAREVAGPYEEPRNP